MPASLALSCLETSRRRSRSASPQPARDAHAAAAGHVDQVPPGQRDLGAQPGALVPHRVLGDLHEDLLAVLERVADAAGALLALGRRDLVDVEEAVLLEPEVDEGGVDAAHHVLDLALVDVAQVGLLVRPLDVDLRQAAVLDQRDAQFLAVVGHQDDAALDLARRHAQAPRGRRGHGRAETAALVLADDRLGAPVIALAAPRLAVGAFRRRLAAASRPLARCRLARRRRLLPSSSAAGAASSSPLRSRALRPPRAAAPAALGRRAGVVGRRLFRRAGFVGRRLGLALRRARRPRLAARVSPRSPLAASRRRLRQSRAPSRGGARRDGSCRPTSPASRRPASASAPASACASRTLRRLAAGLGVRRHGLGRRHRVAADASRRLLALPSGAPEARPLRRSRRPAQPGRQLDGVVVGAAACGGARTPARPRRPSAAATAAWKPLKRAEPARSAAPRAALAASVGARPAVAAAAGTARGAVGISTDGVPTGAAPVRDGASSPTASSASRTISACSASAALRRRLPPRLPRCRRLRGAASLASAAPRAPSAGPAAAAAGSASAGAGRAGASAGVGARRRLSRLPAGAAATASAARPRRRAAPVPPWSSLALSALAASTAFLRPTATASGAAASVAAAPASAPVEPVSATAAVPSRPACAGGARRGCRASAGPCPKQLRRSPAGSRRTRPLCGRPPPRPAGRRPPLSSAGVTRTHSFRPRGHAPRANLATRCAGVRGRTSRVRPPPTRRSGR